MNSLCRLKGIPSFQNADVLIQLVAPKRSLTGLSQFSLGHQELIAKKSNKLNSNGHSLNISNNSELNFGISHLKCK